MRLTLFALAALFISFPAAQAAPGDAPATPATPVTKPAKPVDCGRKTCPLLAVVNLTKQRMTVVIEGVQTYTWKISSGDFGWETETVETHPDGRVYDAYDSQDYPGGPQYGNMGNMPYAVFVDGGTAIHGTPEEMWDRLGRPDSHGCVRLHPDNAKIFNRLVRQYGVMKTWVSIIGEYQWN